MYMLLDANNELIAKDVPWEQIRPIFRERATGVVFMHGTYVTDDVGLIGRLFDQDWIVKRAAEGWPIPPEVLAIA